MASVQSYIRAMVKLGEFPALKRAEAFPAYAIASAKGLIPEMEYAARLALDHPMTFEALGDALRLFGGWALRDLANFRRRCRDNLVTCFDSYLEARFPCIWYQVGCIDSRFPVYELPKWLRGLLSRNQNDLKCQTFARPLDVHSRIRGEYMQALQAHIEECKLCLMTHASLGLQFCVELENKLAQARDKVIYSF